MYIEERKKIRITLTHTHAHICMNDENDRDSNIFTSYSVRMREKKEIGGVNRYSHTVIQRQW